MFSIYKCTILLVWVIKILNCAENSRCPSFYLLSDGALQAKMVVPAPNNHNNMIKFHVQLSIGSDASKPKLKNNILFRGTANDIINKRPLIFSLDLPPDWNNFVTKITTMTINGEQLCLSNRLDAKKFKRVAEINLTKSVRVSITSGSSDNVKSSISTLPPIPNRNTHITQSPKIWTNLNTPKPTQPFKQGFQRIHCYSKPSQSMPLIANGDDAENKMYPWIGALVLQNRAFQCGATLITEKLALTAGHCVAENLKNNLYLVFGTNEYDSFNDDLQFRQVIRSAIHPEYNFDTSDADIAILEMSKELQITDAVKPICLCNFEECFQKNENQTGVVAGWGKNENDQLSKTLKQIHTRIVTEEQCLWSSSSFIYITSNRTFCAGYKNGKGPCKGDSGNGFYMISKGRWVIKGIVSRALLTSDKGRCDLYQYVVYVDVVKHLDWIKKYL